MNLFIKILGGCFGIVVAFAAGNAEQLTPQRKGEILRHKMGYRFVPNGGVPLKEYKKFKRDYFEGLLKDKTSPFYKEYRDLALGASAEEFSGALNYAHEKGILGKDVNILILETDDPKHPLLKMAFTFGGSSNDSHSHFVTGIVAQMAPNAHLYQIDFLYEKKFRDILKGTRPFIINLSQAPSTEEDIKDMKSMADEIFYGKNNQNFLVMAASNEGLPLIDQVEGEILYTSAESEERSGAIASAVTRVADYVISVRGQSFVIVGAVDTNFNKGSFSNYPGKNKEFQERFICTLGVQIPSIEGAIEDDNENPQEKDLLINYSVTKRSGTSYAAPIVTGSMALLKSKYPYLTFVEIKEVLLNSAEKNFFKMLPGNGHRGVFVYDAEEGILPKETEGVTFEPFNPEFYGRGVLSLMRAFIYADIYVKMKSAYPKYSPVELAYRARREFQEELRKTQDKAATKIQALFRGTLARKNLKGRMTVS